MKYSNTNIRYLALFSSALILCACSNSAIKDTAEAIDPLIPKIVDLQSPASTVTSTPVTLKATYMPGIWLDDNPQPSKTLVWSKSAPNQSTGVWDDRKFITPECEPLSTPQNGAERCTAKIYANTDGKYYFRWYFESPSSNDAPISAPEPVGSYSLNIPPPPPPESGDPVISSFNVSEPICADSGATQAQVSYTFDKKNYNTNSAADVCVFLWVNGNVYGGKALACWGNDGSGDYTWNEPTSGSKFIELNQHFGGFENLPATLNFELVLKNPISLGQFDSEQLSRNLTLCGS